VHTWQDSTKQSVACMAINHTMVTIQLTPAVGNQSQMSMRVAALPLVSWSRAVWTHHCDLLPWVLCDNHSSLHACTWSWIFQLQGHAPRL
jgi:hypothetical protein